MQKKYFYSFFTILTLISLEEANSMSMIWGLNPHDMRAKETELPQKVRFMDYLPISVGEQPDFQELSIAEQWAKLEKLVKMLSSSHKEKDEASLSLEQKMRELASDLMEKCNSGSSSDSLIKILQENTVQLTETEQKNFSERIWDLVCDYIQHIRKSRKKPGELPNILQVSSEINEKIAAIPSELRKVLKYKHRSEGQKLTMTYHEKWANSIFALNLKHLEISPEILAIFNGDRLHFNFDPTNPAFSREDTLLTEIEYLALNRDYPHFEKLNELLEFSNNINALIADLEERHIDIEQSFRDILLEEINRVRGNAYLSSMDWNAPKVAEENEEETRSVVQLLRLIRYLYSNPEEIISSLKVYFKGSGEDTRPVLPPLPEGKSLISEIKTAIEEEKKSLESQLFVPETFDARLDYILNWDGQGNSLIDNFNLDEFLKLIQSDDLNNIFNVLKFAKEDILNELKCEYGDLLELLKHEYFVARNRCNFALMDFIREVIIDIYDTEDAYTEDRGRIPFYEMFDVQNAVRTGYLLFEPILASSPDYKLVFKGGFWNNILANFNACQINLMEMMKQKLKFRPGNASVLDLPDGGVDEDIARDLIGHSISPDNVKVDCGTQQFFDGRLSGYKCMFNSTLQFPLKNNMFNGIFHFNVLLGSSLNGYYNWLDSHKLENPAIGYLISILELGKGSSTLMPNLDYTHPIFNYLLGMNVFCSIQNNVHGDAFAPNAYGPISYIYNSGNVHFKLIRNKPRLDRSRVVAERPSHSSSISSSVVTLSPWGKKIKTESYFAFGNQSYLDSLVTVPTFRQLWLEWRISEDEHLPEYNPKQLSPLMTSLNIVAFDPRPEHKEAKEIALLYSGMWKTLMKPMSIELSIELTRGLGIFSEIWSEKLVEMEKIRKKIEANVDDLLVLEKILPPKHERIQKPILIPSPPVTDKKSSDESLSPQSPNFLEDSENEKEPPSIRGLLEFGELKANTPPTADDDALDSKDTDS